MYKNSFFKPLLFLTIVLFFVSCDKDYNDIGANLIADNHFGFTTYHSNVVAYNQAVDPIQSDNLPINALGIYDNPNFGKTTANFATQLSLETPAPTIGANAVIQSVVLTVPYFNKKTATDATTGVSTYTLDSIYGGTNKKIKLSVYESGYDMRLVAGTVENFYTNQNADFDANKIGSRLNNGIISENDEFIFDPTEYVETTTDAAGKEIKTYTAPGMRLNLNTSFFKTKILDVAVDAANKYKLATNIDFTNYIKGLYFKVENSGSDVGSLAMLDFSLGKITIKYKEDLVTNGVTTQVDKVLNLKFTGNKVSLLQHTKSPAYTTAIASANTTLGDEKLYLKGGEGSMAIINLFSDPNELANIRANNWLINEASLTFTIDAANMANSYEPQRIYLYDLNNKRPIVDYYNDSSAGTYAKNGQTVLGGIIKKDANGKGQTYKIRLTDQIRNLIKNTDSTNVKLGLVVTENIGTITNSKWRTPKTATTIIPAIPNYTVNLPKFPDFNVQTPTSSVMNPLGTILWGTAPTVPADKRLKLEIYYTKPN